MKGDGEIVEWGGSGMGVEERGVRERERIGEGEVSGEEKGIGKRDWMWGEESEQVIIADLRGRHRFLKYGKCNG